MGLKSSESSFITRATVAEVGRALQAAFAKAKAAGIDRIESGSGALSGFDDRAAIEVVGHGQGSLLSGQWAVQVYVFDHGDTREVQLVALGDSGMTRAWNGATNSASLTVSTKKRDLIVSMLPQI